MTNFDSIINKGDSTRRNKSVENREVGSFDGWNEWSRHVLSELERLNVCYSSLDQKVTAMMIKTSTDIAMLKVKSGVWGAIGGLIPVAVVLIVVLIKYVDK